MKKTFFATNENIRETCLEAQGLFQDWKVPEIESGDMVLSLDEALTNIKIHGYNDVDNHDSRIIVEIFKDKSKINIIIIDDARQYSLDNIHALDTSTYLGSNMTGGFGLSIIKKLMDSIILFRTGNQNVLWMYKEIAFSGIAQPNKIETKTADACIEEGILKVIAKPGCTITLEDAVEQIDFYIRLVEKDPGQKAYAMVIDTRGMKMITKEARKYYTDFPQMGILAIAIIIDSVFGRWLGNLFISLNKKDQEIKLFNADTNALAWVRNFHEDNLNSFRNHNLIKSRAQ